MSRNATIALVVIVLLALGGWWYMNSSGPEAYQSDTSSQSSAYPASSEGTNTSGTSVSVSSDASLDQDAANIDAEMNALSSDTSKADNGLNNQNQ